MSDDALRYEILDKNTGHSIATRVVNEVMPLYLIIIKCRLRARLLLDDQFTIQRTESGAGDARNLDALIAQQSTT